MGAGFSIPAGAPSASQLGEKITLIPQHYYKIFFLST